MAKLFEKIKTNHEPIMGYFIKNNFNNIMKMTAN